MNIRKLAATVTDDALMDITKALRKSERTLPMGLSGEAIKDVTRTLQNYDKVLPDNIINDMIRSGSAPDLYRQAGRYRMSPTQLKETLEYMSTKELIPAMEKTKYMGFIPGVKIKRNPVRSGYLERAAKELGSVITRKSRNKKLLMGAGTAAALGAIAHSIFSDSKEDKYKRKVDDVLKRYQLAN